MFTAIISHLNSTIIARNMQLLYFICYLIYHIFFNHLMLNAFQF